MISIKEVCREIRDTIYNDETLSLPFVAKYRGVEQLAFFVFDCEYIDDDKMQINRFNRLIYVNLSSDEVSVIECIDKVKVPVLIQSELSIDIDEMNALYDQYYKNLQDYFNKSEAALIDAKNSFDRIVPADLAKIYVVLGATFS